MKRYISIKEKYKTKYEQDENGNSIPIKYDDTDEEDKEVEEKCSKKKK